MTNYGAPLYGDNSRTELFETGRRVGDELPTRTPFLGSMDDTVVQAPKHQAEEGEEQFAEFVGQYFGIRVITRRGMNYISRRHDISKIDQAREKFEAHINHADPNDFCVLHTREGEVWIRVGDIESFTIFSWEMVNQQMFEREVNRP